MKEEQLTIGQALKGVFIYGFGVTFIIITAPLWSPFALIYFIILKVMTFLWSKFTRIELLVLLLICILIYISAKIMCTL